MTQGLETSPRRDGILDWTVDGVPLSAEELHEFHPWLDAIAALDDGPGADHNTRIFLGKIRRFRQDHADQKTVIVQHDADYDTIMRLGQLLDEIAVTLKGPNPSGGRHSYHDLPEIAHQMKEEIAALIRKTEKGE